MKIPFFKTKEIPKLTFEELIELLRINDFKKLQYQKQKGQNFMATDSYDGINILEYYIKNHADFPAWFSCLGVIPKMQSSVSVNR